jgi:DNA-binding LacI/PurR family transcriptional regulator
MPLRTRKNNRRQAAVMADVAKSAGVSHQTVSRVLHDSPHVRHETRERVLAAIRELRYRPSLVAQALVTGRSNTLGVVTFDTALYGPASTLLGVEKAAHEAGYGISVVSMSSLDPTSIRVAVDRLRGQGVDGIVVIGPQKSSLDSLQHLELDIPYVAAACGPDSQAQVVAIDQAGGAACATRHLLDLGHKTVWHLGGTERSMEATRRIEGWLATLEAAGAPVPPLLRGDWSANSGYELGRQLLETPGVTAVFVANDQMALGLLRRFHEAGVLVPRDISVVGFDDVPEAAFFIPPLTTVRQDFHQVGRRCLELLVGEIKGAPPVDVVKAPIPTEMVLRASTARPSR